MTELFDVAIVFPTGETAFVKNVEIEVGPVTFTIYDGEKDTTEIVPFANAQIITFKRAAQAS